jgi:hypothetical protein
MICARISRPNSWVLPSIHQTIHRRAVLPQELIERARLRARSQEKTLNAAFREWPERCASAATGTQDYDQLRRRLNHVRTRRSFTRDEMNTP